MARQSKQETVELEVYVVRLTKAAMLVTPLEDLEKEDAREIWLPLSQVDINHINHANDHYKITIPEWLATKQGLV